MKLTVVLHSPQNLINIAVVIRAMKNFGFRDLRLVSPGEFDIRRIEGIAHKTGDIVERAQVFDDFDSAVADFTMVVGLTARGRTVRRNAQFVEEAAKELVALGESEKVAVFSAEKTMVWPIETSIAVIGSSRFRRPKIIAR